jgi:signal transduction histidine kinase
VTGRAGWPTPRLRTILFGVLLFAAAMPAMGAIFLRVYENTVVRQSEAELTAQGAALAALASVDWPGATPPRPRPIKPDADYFRPESPTVDLTRDEVLPERPMPVRAARPADPSALAVGARLAPVIERTTRITLASVAMTDRTGVGVAGPGLGGDYSRLPEVVEALAGRSSTVLRTNGDYQPIYSFEWLSRASGLRLHHARPILVDGRVEGVLLLSRSPWALFRGVYEDRGQLILGGVVILAVLVLLAGLVSRGVTQPVEKLSAASRAVAAGGGEIPPTPALAAAEIQALYEDFRAMAERIERRGRYLRDFAAAVSHEFKTPLAGINGAVELLQDHFETMSADERRRFLNNIAGDSERLSRLVTRLLDLARADMATPEAGVSSDVPSPLQRAVEREARPEFVVEMSLPDDLPRVAAPETTLESVLTILLQNARQVGAGHVKLAAMASGGRLTITVSDDGPGVPEADRERLFEPFFTSRRSEGGTGLGLPIARSLLAASGGTLELVESARGATFQVTLPKA